MKKRRRSPNLPQDEGAPRLFWVLSEWGHAHPFYGGTPPLFWVLTQNQQAPIHFPILSPPPAFNQLIPPPPPYPGQWGDHTPLPQAKAEETHLGHDGLGVRPLASVWTVGDYPGHHTEVRIRQDFTSVPESSWLRRELHRKVQQTHSPPHTWGMMASVCGLWPQYGQLETTQAITLKSGSSRTSLQFLNLPGLGRNCIRSSVISAWGWGQGVLPACWVAYKSRPRRTSGQSTASDGHCHTPRGHNLNYTIWILYAESVS